ncbi:MAG: creatininase family protein [Candidatus Lokiarchaeota archaeon]|nr:creatininase family protein [Candidatus Lokiarchaeota archaeon]
MSRLIFIPVGSFEQHGPHLPPETDYLIAKKIAESIAENFSEKIIEGIKIGISFEHGGFKNTKSITQEDFISMFRKIINKINENIKLVIINAHGGNIQTLKIIESLYPKKTIILNIFSLVKDSLETYRTSEIGGICHAGEFETSLMLFLYPQMVNMNKITKEDIVYVPSLDPNFKKKRMKDWKTIHLSKSGILGDPYHASKKKGKKWYKNIIKKAIDIISSSFS